MSEAPYDAFLLLSFGGPEGEDDVLPFLENVTRGRGVPAERLQEVAKHYHHFGGVSPINQQNRDLLAAIRADFAAHHIDLPIYWGNRNWHPFLTDTVTQMAKDGVQRALAFTTAAFAGYSSCRQYLEDIALARREVGDAAPQIDKVPHYFDQPGLVQAHADGVREALVALPASSRSAARFVYTAHSIPTRMAQASGPNGNLYAEQLMTLARLVTESVVPGQDFDLVWQSRSGPPSVPWLEPDINDHLADLAHQGVPAVVVSPIGFVSDHLEVVWDLDHEAAATAGELGIDFARAATPGVHPAFVGMIHDLVVQHMTSSPAEVCTVDGCVQP